MNHATVIFMYAIPHAVDAITITISNREYTCIRGGGAFTPGMLSGVFEINPYGDVPFTYMNRIDTLVYDDVVGVYTHRDDDHVTFVRDVVKVHNYRGRR